MNTKRAIPYDQIETLFVDVGNTLISMDFQWICSELQALGSDCRPSLLQRAEAAARPTFSRRMGQRSEKDGKHMYTAYFAEILSHLSRLGVTLSHPAAQLAEDLVPVLAAPGMTQRLWSFVLPGVPEALATLKEIGVQLVVVSNSDGTVERGLADQGLDHYFDAILDSHIVGYEKPDPRIFFRAIEISGAVPARTLHVGDMYDADVIGAQAAGLHAVLLDPYDDWQDIDCPCFPDLTSLQQVICTAHAT